MGVVVDQGKVMKAKEAPIFVSPGVEEHEDNEEVDINYIRARQTPSDPHVSDK